MSDAYARIAPLITPRRCLLAALTFFALMVAIGSLPGKADAAASVVGDKPLHFIAYATLAALVFGALGSIRISFSTANLLTLVVIALLGAIDESIQSLLPYRHANWSDWRVNMLAAVTSLAILILLQPFRSSARRDIGTPQTRFNRVK